MVSAAGPNAAPGANGCVYPPAVQTLFNQFDAAHIIWKGYAQDLGIRRPQHPRTRRGPAILRRALPRPGRIPSKLEPNPRSALASDQYLPKHFPFPWFESLVSNPGDCSSTHIASLFSPSNGLAHDLQDEATTPAFSWITPNMCSDGHDAVCHGDNLSRGLHANNPANFTGGLYAADLFLRRIVPEIEASPAFEDGGLIDITFDEAFPPFTYTHNSFANSKLVPPNAATTLANDSAGETIVGRGPVHWEPPGPNLPLIKDARGQELTPGPGHNQGLDRPSNCVKQTTSERLAPGTCILGGGGTVPGPATHPTASAPPGSETISDNSIVIIDQGRSVTDASTCHGIPPGTAVGPVVNTPVMAHAPPPAGFVDTGKFTLVSLATNRPVKTIGRVCGVKLGARTPADDPLYDFGDPTTGGGDTGSVLISPYIKPGTKVRTLYNHYSWLRTIEDLFGVAHACTQAVCRGLDGSGHLGYAAQIGLVPYGPDVFTRPNGPPARQRRHASGDGLPEWLPAPSAAVSVEQASAQRPALAVQGDTLMVDLRRSRVRVTAIGPAIPATTSASPPAEMPCSFTVTLTTVSGSVPVDADAFAVLDEYGRRHALAPVASSGLRRLASGQSLTLTLRTVLPAGEGQLIWAPDHVHRVVSWDFDVETL